MQIDIQYVQIHTIQTNTYISYLARFQSMPLIYVHIQTIREDTSRYIDICADTYRYVQTRIQATTTWLAEASLALASDSASHCSTGPLGHGNGGGGAAGYDRLSARPCRRAGRFKFTRESASHGHGQVPTGSSLRAGPCRGRTGLDTMLSVPGGFKFTL